MKIIEVVPNTYNALRKVDFYTEKGNPWMYIYRKDSDTASRMLKEANAMIDSGKRFVYENPSFGWTNWCCVTFVSYLATIATNHYWKMGSNANAYIWSPRYGYGYDKALLDMGFRKLNYGSVKLKTGDIIQSWTHAGIVEEEDMTTTQRGILDAVERTTLRKGSQGELVTYIQQWLSWYGWYKGNHDGDYGNLTEQAVKDWQTWEGREATGEIRAEDWKIIETAYEID